MYSLLDSHTSLESFSRAGQAPSRNQEALCEFGLKRCLHPPGKTPYFLTYSFIYKLLGTVLCPKPSF